MPANTMPTGQIWSSAALSLNAFFELTLGPACQSGISNEICFHQYHARLPVGRKRGTLEPNGDPAQAGGARCAGIGHVPAAVVAEGRCAIAARYRDRTLPFALVPGRA